MADTQIDITEADLSVVVHQKVNQCTNLEIRLAALYRTLQERDTQITELEGQLNGIGRYGKGEQDAESR